jgi:hypothetical protein
VWCDPKHPDAYHDPALRAYLGDRAALVRFNSNDATFIIKQDGVWMQKDGTSLGRDHTLEEVLSA